MSSRTAPIAVAAVALVCAGLWLGGHPDALPSPLRDVFVEETFSDVAARTIEDNYFEDVPDERLEDASVDGMVDFLRRRYDDAFSHYFDPEELESFRELTTGRFSGVGMSVLQVRRGLRVSRVFPDSPARGAGIRAGDVVVEVNGEKIAGDQAELATARIKGPAGTTVRLGVFRPATGKTRRLRIERAELSVPVVLSGMERAGGERIGYVLLTDFTEGAHGEVRQAIDRLDERGADALVFDLRGNGGGFLREAILTASVFVEQGEVVVTTQARTQGREVYRASGKPISPRPTAVLINRDTASAAEIVAAALQEYDLARIVGTRSFGKGVFQQVIELSNGGALDLTVGEYLAASGESLAGSGVEPDVTAEDRPGTARDEALARALAILAGSGE